MTTSESYFEKMQKEQLPWQQHNFGDRPSFHPLLGIVEEVGEFVLAMQYASPKRMSNAKMKDGYADVFIFAADLCNAMGWNLQRVFDDKEELEEERDGEVVSLLKGNTKTTHAQALSIAVGSLCHHFLKNEQNIRGSEEYHHFHMQKALGSVFWHLGWIMDMDDEDTYLLVELVWSEVKKRDWKKHPNTADQEARK